jgi:hypothetical protein
MQPVDDVREVVEVGWRAREPEQDAVEVVSLLDVARPDIHVRHVATDTQLAAEELRRLEAAVVRLYLSLSPTIVPFW